MTTNIQSFAGDVKIDNGNLSVKSLEVKDNITKLASNNSSYSNVGILMTRKGGASNVALVFSEDGSNVLLGYTNDQGGDDQVDMLTSAQANLVVYGNIYVTGSFVGDGASLTGLVTDLQSVTEFGGSTDQTIRFTNDDTGIIVSSNALVSGNVTAEVYYGDGGLLSNITQTLEGITAIGNTTPYTIEFTNTDNSFVTSGNVGVSNTNPTADLCVGSNVVIDDTNLNKIDVVGNVACYQLNLGSVEILPAYSLENVTQISNTTTRTISFNNSTLAFDTQKMAGIGIIPSSADVGVSGLHVDGHLRLGGEAENTDEEQMYIKAAGALGVLANESDTNNTNTELRLQSGDTNNSNITMVGKSSAQYMTFGTNAAERMRIDSSGNLGIGTASPSCALEVFKDGPSMVKIGDSTSYLRFDNGGHHIDVRNTSDGSGKLLYLNYYSGAGVEIDDRLGVGGYPLPGRANLYVYGNTYTTSNITSADTIYGKSLVVTGSGQYEPGSIYSDANWGMLFRAKQASPALGEFLWTNSDGTHIMMLDEEANLGIGTDSPGSKLEVFGNAYVTSNLTVGTANLFVDTTTSRVGIGTTNPQSLLHISSGTSGDAHLILEADTDNDNENDNPKLVFRQDGGYYTGEIGLDSNRMVFRNKSTTVENTGFAFYANVIQGGSSTTDINDVETTQVRVMSINGIGDVELTGNLEVSSSNLFVDTTTSRVGVGTASPGAKLHVVVPDIGNTTEVLRLQNGNGTGDILTTSGGFIGMHLRDNNVGGGEVARISWKHDGTDSSAEGLGQLGFWTSNTGGAEGVPEERMTIRADGNVGIGTNTPQAKLDTRGDAIFDTGKDDTTLTGLLNYSSTQSAIDAGINNTVNGSLTASTDIAPPPGVAGDVIAKFVNSHTTEVITNQFTASPLSITTGDVIYFGIWVYATLSVSVEYFFFGPSGQSVGFTATGNSTWTWYEKTITSTSTTSTPTFRIDNNSAGKTYYFTGFTIRKNPSQTTGLPFTPRYSPMLGRGSVLNTTTLVAREAAIKTLTGNVGIGTTNPLSTVDISGTTGLILRNTADKTAVDDRVGYIEFYNGSTVNGNMSSAIEACVNVGGANNNTDLRFKTSLDYNNSLVERMRIDRAGNVGIGTTNPGYTLDVAGSINLTSNIVMSGEVFVKAHDATKNYVAVGRGAGQSNQGTQAVAVGYLAGQTNQHDNTVVLNASGSALNTEGTGRTYIKPLRVATVASNVMTYDQTTGEVMDSGGLFTNRLAVVSQQPPEPLTGLTTTIQGHGKYVNGASSPRPV
jgi:hypothetical protein